ncbi:MAG: cytochrome c biogenesis protein ResB [bacterium]
MGTMAETTAQRTREPSALTRAWRVAGSLRVGIALLAVITGASVVGIVLPQPESFRANSYVRRRIDPQSPKALARDELATLKAVAGVEDRPERPPTSAEYLRIYYVDEFGTVLGWVLLSADVHRLFSSWWFWLLCALFVVSLSACSLRRVRGQWRAAFGIEPGSEPRWYERRRTHASRSLPAEPGDATAAVERELRARGFRVRARRGEGGTIVDAARGPLGRLSGLGRLGSQVVHGGVVLIVLGGFVSGRLSRSHDQVAAPGDVVEVPPAASLRAESREELAAADWRHDSDPASSTCAFRLRLDDFEARFTPQGEPEYYGAEVTLIDTVPPLERTIEVNRPLVYKGYHVYQQSYQRDFSRITSVTFRVARVEREGEAGGGVHGPLGKATVLDSVEIVAEPGEPAVAPGMGVAVRVLKYFPHWVAPFEEGPEGERRLGTPRNASDEPRNPAILVRVEAPGGQPFERWLFLVFREGDRGRTLDYGPFRITPTDVEPGYNTVLNFKTHPVLWPVWLGCGVMMAGILLCFYCPHERVWALVRPAEGGGSAVWLAGDSFKWRDRFRRRFDATVAALASDE